MKWQYVKVRDWEMESHMFMAKSWSMAKCSYGNSLLMFANNMLLGE